MPSSPENPATSPSFHKPAGETWNESRVYTDPTTLKQVRQITCQGVYNQTPNYHTATGFTKDGSHLIFATAREGRSALCKADTATGEITRLTRWFDGMGCLDELHKMNG